MFEHLELRRHFSIVAADSDGLLRLSGTDDADDVSLSIDGDTVTVACDGQSASYYSVIEIQFETGAGDDTVAVTLESATPALTLDTGDGNDSVTVASTGSAPLGLLNIITGSGDDAVDCSSCGAAVSIAGGDGSDTLIGSSSNDVISGGEGDDQILGMNGCDQIAAGSGANFISAVGEDSIIGVDPIGGDGDYAPTVVETYPGFFEITGDWHNDSISISVSQENATFEMNGTTFGNVSFITVNSNGGDDSINIIASDGDSPIGAAVNAGDGNDRVVTNVDAAIDCGNGADRVTMQNAFRGVVHGGAGNDSITLKGASAECYLFGEDGNDLLDASNSQYSVGIRGGSGDDTLYGSALSDALYGEGDNDRIMGLGGADLIDGGSGYDYLDGGDGHDVFYAASGWTVVGGSGNDTLYAFALDGNASGVENIYLRTQ